MMTARRWFLMVPLSALVLVFSACTAEKGGSVVSPSLPILDVPAAAPSASLLGPLSMVEGTWTGTETASVGQSGTLSVTFTQEPSPSAAVAATLAWTSATTSLTFHGTLTGTLGAMVITATDAPTGGCSYNATGALNEAGTVITGSFTGFGPGKCPTKAGTFTLSGHSHQPTCAELNPPSFSKIGPTWVNYTPAVPPGPTYKYYTLDDIDDGDWGTGATAAVAGTDDINSDDNDDRQRFCSAQSGTWINEGNDGTFNPSGSNICRFASTFNFTADRTGSSHDFNIDSFDLEDTHQFEDGSPAAGIKVHGEATFNNAATWKAILRASTGDVKGEKTKVLACGEHYTINGTSAAIDDDLHYESPTAHTTSTFTIEVYRNGVLQ